MQHFKLSFVKKHNAGLKANPFSIHTFFAVALAAIMLTGCREESYILTISSNPEYAGTVTALPEITGAIEEGTTVSVAQEPAACYVFNEWSGDGEGDADTLEIIMDSDKNIVAEYIPSVGEYFDDASVGSFTDDLSGRWAINNNAYVLTGTGAYTMAYSMYNCNIFGNCFISVDIKMTGESTSYFNPAGICFRSQSLNPQTASYWFAFRANGDWYFGKEEEGTFTFIQTWVASSDIVQGMEKTNNLKVICSGNTFEVYINGVSQGTYTDETLTSGYIGLLGFDNTGYTNTYVFDNITVGPVSSEGAGI